MSSFLNLSESGIVIEKNSRSSIFDVLRKAIDEFICDDDL